MKNKVNELLGSVAELTSEERERFFDALSATWTPLLVEALQIYLKPKEEKQELFDLQK